MLVLSQYVEERYGRELLESGAEGTGYLLKDRVADVGEFVSALEEVGSGGTVLDPEVVGQLLARRRRDDDLSSLTPREKRSSPSSPRAGPTARSPVRSSSPKVPWKAREEHLRQARACPERGRPPQGPGGSGLPAELVLQ